jgi:hypothetical protein
MQYVLAHWSFHSLCYQWRNITGGSSNEFRFTAMAAIFLTIKKPKTTLSHGRTPPRAMLASCCIESCLFSGRQDGSYD